MSAASSSTNQPFSGLPSRGGNALGTDGEVVSNDDEGVSEGEESTVMDADDSGDNIHCSESDGESDGEKIHANWQVVKSKSPKTNKRKKPNSDAKTPGTPSLSGPKKSKTNENNSTDISLSNTTESVQETAKHVVYIRGQSTDLMSLNPIKLSQSIQARFGQLRKIEKRGQSLKITCESLATKEAILRCKSIENTDIISSLPNSELRRIRENSKTIRYKVVISGVPYDLSNDDIASTTGADEVRRIEKRNEIKQKIPTTAVILGFNRELSEVPKRVQIGYLMFKTRTYVPFVTRCFKCQGFNHVASNCTKRTSTCPVCSGKHTFDECTTKDVKRCANCSGDHSASFKGCPKYIEVQGIKKRAAENHISYRDALMLTRKEQKETMKNTTTTANISTTTNYSSTPGIQQTKYTNPEKFTSSQTPKNTTTETGVQTENSPSDPEHAAQSSKSTEKSTSTNDGISDLMYKLLTIVVTSAEDTSIKRNVMLKNIMGGFMKIFRCSEEEICTLVQKCRTQKKQTGNEQNEIQTTPKSIKGPSSGKSSSDTANKQQSATNSKSKNKPSVNRQTIKNGNE